MRVIFNKPTTAGDILIKDLDTEYIITDNEGTIEEVHNASDFYEGAEFYKVGSKIVEVEPIFRPLDTKPAQPYIVEQIIAGK